MKCREGSAAFYRYFLNITSSLFQPVHLFFIIGAITWSVRKGVEHFIIFHLNLLVLSFLRRKEEHCDRGWNVGSGAFCHFDFVLLF